MAALKPKHPELLRPGQSLVYNTPNDRLTSPNGDYSLIVGDGQIYIVENSLPSVKIWFKGNSSSEQTTLKLFTNNLVLNNTSLFKLPESIMGELFFGSREIEFLAMQDDGNLVLYGKKGSSLQHIFWSSESAQKGKHVQPQAMYRYYSSEQSSPAPASAAVVSEYSFAVAASAEDTSTRSLIDSAAAGGAGDGGRAERMRAKFAEMGLAAENAGTPTAAAAATPYTPPPKGPIVLSANPNIETAKNTNTTVSQANMLSLRLDLLKGTNEYSWAILTIQELFKYDPALLKRILLKVVDNDKGSLYIFRMFAKIPSTENPFIALAPIPAEKQRLARVPYAIDNLIKILNKNGTNTKAQHISLLLYAALTEREILNTFGDEPGRGGSRNSKKKTLTQNMRNYKKRRSIRR